jgi:hypothetical protein
VPHKPAAALACTGGPATRTPPASRVGASTGLSSEVSNQHRHERNRGPQRDQTHGFDNRHSQPRSLAVRGKCINLRWSQDRTMTRCALWNPWPPRPLSCIAAHPCPHTGPPLKTAPHPGGFSLGGNHSFTMHRQGATGPRCVLAPVSWSRAPPRPDHVGAGLFVLALGSVHRRGRVLSRRDGYAGWRASLLRLPEPCAKSTHVIAVPIGPSSQPDLPSVEGHAINFRARGPTARHIATLEVCA